MRHLLALFPITPDQADRAVEIIGSLNPRRLLAAAALFAFVYTELVLIGVALGGGQ